MINAFGLSMTGTVFVVVMITKFLSGAWIAILAMVIFYAIMRAIRSHYDRVELGAHHRGQRPVPADPGARDRARLQAPQADDAGAGLRQGEPAEHPRGGVRRRGGRPSNKLVDEWDAQRIDVPLKLLYSPFREIIRPIVDYATEIRRANPRGVVAVYIPEYVVGRWWEQVLHNQTALRLKGRLLFTPGVMVTSVPYQLRGSEKAQERDDWERNRAQPGDVRRGRTRSGR